MANTIRHTALAGGIGVPAAVVPPTIRHTKLAGSVPVTAPAAKVRHTKLAGGAGGGFSVSAGVGRIRHTRLRGTTAKSTNLQARAGADVTVSALEEFRLDGSKSTGNIGGNGDSSDTGYRWLQLPGDVDVPKLLLDDRAASPVVTAPATWTGYEVTFQLQVTDGIAVSTDTVTVAVRPWPAWRAALVAGVLQWVPKQRFVAISGTTARASFTATPAMGNAPLLVQFTDTSQNILAGWQWDFGDGTTSTLQNPAHLYDQVGSYQVTLTVKNSAGTYVSTPQTVDVSRPTPTANLGVHGGSTAESVNSAGHSLAELLRVHFRPATVYANGSRGEFIHHMMAWTGARKMAVTLTGGTIPATVTAVAVSAHNFNTTAGNVLSVRNGTLGGVRGKMTWAANVWYFTRTTAGPAVTVPAGSLFTADIGVDQADTVPLFVCPAKNDLTSMLDPAASYANLQTLTSGVKTNPARFLVTTNWVNQGASTAERNAINTMNASTRVGYGTRCVDIATYLAGSQVWIDAGMVGSFAQGAPTADDATAQAGGVVVNAYLPPSLSSDFQHLNAVGYRLFEKLQADRLVSLGYEPAIQGPLSVFVGNPASLVLADGAAVTAWKGAAGSLETAAAAGSSGVTYKAADPRFNGNPAVLFDGTAGLDTGAWPAGRNYDYPLTVAAVFVRDDSSAMNLLTGRGSEYAYLGVTGAGMVTMGAGAATQISVAAPAVGVLTYAVAVFNGTRSALYVYDGTTVTSAVGTTGTEVATAGWPGIRIASTAAGTGNFWNGGIGWLEAIDGTISADEAAARFAALKSKFEPVAIASVRMVSPLWDEAVVGDRFLEVDIAASEGATSVEFQVGHFDRARYPASRVPGSATRWRSNVAWRSKYNVANQAVLAIEDYCYYVVPWINGVERYGTAAGGYTFSRCHSENFVDPTAKVEGAWRPALAFTPNMTSAAAFDASFESAGGEVYGDLPNPDGSPTLTIVTEATTGKKMSKISLADDHTTADQPNANVRRQNQSNRIITDGDDIWFGFSINLPNTPNTASTPGFPPVGQIDFSELALMQTMFPIGNDFERALRMMLRAVIKGGTNGTTDMLREHLHIGNTDGHSGDPKLMFQHPMLRGQTWGFVMHWRVSYRTKYGFVEIFTQEPGSAELTPYELFGIDKYFRAPFAVAPGSIGRIDLPQMYHGRNKPEYVGRVEVLHGPLRIGATKEAVAPNIHIPDVSGATYLIQENWSAGVTGTNITNANSQAATVTPGANNSIQFDGSEG